MHTFERTSSKFHKTFKRTSFFIQRYIEYMSSWINYIGAPRFAAPLIRRERERLQKLRENSTGIWQRGNMLTSAINVSLIMSDFLAMIYKNEQPRTASLYRG